MGTLLINGARSFQRRACRISEQVAAAPAPTSRSHGGGHNVSRDRRLDRLAAAAAAWNESEFREPPVFELDADEFAAFGLHQRKAEFVVSEVLAEAEATENYRRRSAAHAASAAENQGFRYIDLPGYVRNCSRNPDPARQNLAAYSWLKCDCETVTRSPYCCRSWRCPFGCAVHERHVMFARIAEALEDVPPQELVLLVLTLDGHLHAQLGDFELDGLYRSLRERNEWFRKRIRRMLVKLGLGDFESAWVSVIEQHESGVPHINIVVHAPAWARWLKERIRVRMKSGLRGKRARYIASVNDRRDSTDEAFLKALRECGFGYASTADVVASKDAVTNYMCKVAAAADETAARVQSKIGRVRAGVSDASRRRTAERAVAEVTKDTQLPIRAPKGFRRLRSGVGFLPPRRKNPDTTGTIVRRRRTPEGDEVIAPMVSSKRDDLVLMNAFVADLEQSIAWSEEETRARELKAKTLMGVYGVKAKKDRFAGVSKHRLDPEMLRAVGLLKKRPEGPQDGARAGPD
jgi:hypothetical protein